MNIATSWNGVSSELVSHAARGNVTTRQGFVQEKDMTSRLFALTIAAAMAVAGSAFAAGYSSSTPSKATTKATYAMTR